MAKAFFTAVVLLMLGGISFFAIMRIGLLPLPAYMFVYSLEQKLPGHHGTTIPSLEKYEGVWVVTFTATAGDSLAINECDRIEGIVRVHDGAFSGAIGPFGETFSFHATATDGSSLTGALAGTAQQKAIVRAQIQGSYGEGTWSGNYGCSGTVELIKQNPVIDPVVGKVFSLKGDAELLREGSSKSLLPGMALYRGDEIKTEVGATAILTLDEAKEPVSVMSDSTYKVSK